MNLKKMQILDRLARIKRDAELKDEVVRKLDLQTKFNPDKHDEMMDEIFAQAGPEEFEMDEEGNPKKPEFVDDYDALPLLSKTEALIRRKREMDVCPDLEQDLEDYYSMDFEDVIGGDLYCRFKYREVEPNDYGMNLCEILLNEPKDINGVVGRKMLAPYREDKGRMRKDVIAKKMEAVETFKRFEGPSAKVDPARLSAETVLLGSKRKALGSVSRRKQKRRRRKSGNN